MPDSRLLQRLIAFRRTVRIRLLLFGVFAVACVGICAFLVMVGLDWLLHLPPVPRLGTGLVFLAGSVAALLHWVVRPLLQPIGLGQIAGKLEEYRWRLDGGAAGTFDDGLSSTVDFLLGDQAGSAVMRSRVIARTDRLVRNISFGDVLSLRPLAVRCMSLIVAVALLVVIEAASPGFAATGVQRYLAPFGPVRWPRKVEIVPLSTDVPVPVGESTALRMKVVRGLTPALRGVVHLRSPDGRVTSLAMQREGSDNYVCTISAITEDLTCWFEAGDDHTRERPLDIRAVQRPAVVEALASVDPPPYALRAPSLVADLKAGEVSAVIGSTVTVSVRSSQPVGTDSSGSLAAGLEFKDGTAAALYRGVGQDSQWLETSFELRASAEFKVRLGNTMGLENRGGRSYRLLAEPDQTPSVVLLEPQAVTSVTPGGSVPMLVRAEDDFGLTALRIVGREIDTDNPVELSISDRMAVMPAGERVVALAQHVWDLASLGLSPGAAIVYHVEATDNYAYGGAGPQTGRSPQQRIKIISLAEFEERLRDEFALLQDRIRRAMLNQEAIKDKTVEARNETQEEGPPTVAQLEEAAGLATSQARLANRVQALSRSFERIRRRVTLNNIDNATLQQQVASLAGQLRETAAGPASTASRRLGKAANPAATDRKEQLTRAGDDQQEVVDTLARMIRFMDRWGDFQEAVAKTRALLDRQQEVRRRTGELGKRTLGRRPESLSEQELARLREAQRRQRQLAEETEQLLERLRRLADRLAAKDPAAAAALKEALRAGLAGDAARHMREADRAIEDNRIAAADIEQRAAEAGLANMLAGLQERRRRELAELAKRIEDARQAVAELLQQQRDLLEANVEASRLGADLEVFGRQADQQHTLSRNTLRLANEMAGRDQVAGPVRLVRRSAEPMAEAASALIEADGPTAQTQQSEAVDLLVQALTELEELARKAAEQAWKRSLAALKDKLETIRNRQRMVNSESAMIIALVAKNERLTRKENRKVARLAKVQVRIRPDVVGVREQLGKAAVYRWVIDQVLELIDRSHQALSTRRLDQALADTQERIVNELDLLIDALNEAVQLPSPDQYAEAQGSGGGGGGHSGRNETSVPGVAELLVLKSMQLDLNARTARRARDFDAETASEEQLGELQQLARRQQTIEELTRTVTERAQSGPH